MDMPCCSSSCFLLVSFCALFIYKFLDWIIRRPMIGRYSERYILVTGCDSGFGNLLAKRLDSLGCHVFAGCLTETGETELKKCSSGRMHVLSLDVSKPDSVKRALAFVKEKLPPGKGLWGVMNNAGICTLIGPPEWSTIDDYKNMNAVNLYGLIDVTMTFLPLVKMVNGRIVNTSSMAGRLSTGLTTPYAVSKYGVEAFTDGLRRSLYNYGCKAIMIEPGSHKTSLLASDNVRRSFETAWSHATPDIKAEFGEDVIKYYLSKSCLESSVPFASDRLQDVVDAYVHALLGLFPRARYVVGMDAKLCMPLMALPEWLSDWLLHKVIFSDAPLPAALKTVKL